MPTEKREHFRYKTNLFSLVRRFALTFIAWNARINLNYGVSAEGEKKMENIIIPSSLQITMDDVGWFNGADDRENGGSARTAMSRRHCAEDYLAINELGSRLNMRINCAFILAEWDPDNRLKDIKWLSKYGDGWNNAAYLGKEEMAAVVDAINSSPYIDIAIHGLMHNYYKPGIPYCNSDYFYPIDGVMQMSPEGEVRARLDAFFDLLSHYKINKKVNSFIPPAFSYVWGDISPILKDYGVRFISTLFESEKFRMPEGVTIPVSAAVEGSGIITVNRNNNFVPWYEISTNLDEAPVVSGIFGCHWPNILHEDKTRHSEVIDSWVRYFERCANTFGIILSRDIAFAAEQSLYYDYASVSYEDCRTVIDVSAVPTTDACSGKFYISSRFEIKTASGCEITEYERKDGFINYEVRPIERVMTLA